MKRSDKPYDTVSTIHGKKGYAKGCRCAYCRAAHAAYQRDYYRRNPGRNAYYLKKSRCQKDRKPKGRPLKTKAPFKILEVDMGSLRKREIRSPLLPSDFFYKEYL
jgi:hypothetical protein